MADGDVHATFSASFEAEDTVVVVPEAAGDIDRSQAGTIDSGQDGVVSDS